MDGKSIARAGSTVGDFRGSSEAALSEFGKIPPLTPEIRGWWSVKNMIFLEHKNNAVR